LENEQKTRAVKLIGLTGNIASGKSTVARMLEELGAARLDADELVHQMYEPGSPVVDAIAARFGAGVLAESGAVDRGALGAIVFNDRDAMQALEAIVHPRTGHAIQEWVESISALPIPPPAAVVEAVKLIQSGRHEMMDELWFVIASESVQKQRLMEARGLSEAEAEARLKAQPQIRDLLHFATVIIENSGSLDTLERQVRQAWEKAIHLREEQSDNA
jgi:dephospho-CoA kinase